MARKMAWGWVLAALVVAGCSKRGEVPETAYDPELLEAARKARQAREQEERRYQEEQRRAQVVRQGECSREVGGCREDQVCWDSWYCKRGREDQCSAAGDKQCHPRCTNDSDCPEKMPRCQEVPIFSGSDRGVLERICVKAEE